MGGLPEERLPALVARLMRAGLLQEALAAAGNAPEQLLPLVAALSGPSPAIPAALEAAGEFSALVTSPIHSGIPAGPRGMSKLCCGRT